VSVRVIAGDCRDVLRTLPDQSVHCIVTSPPYFGLRSYLPDGHEDKAKEIGLEQTPDDYVAEMVAVFREARRVLRDDGTFWLNIGDSYAGSAGGRGDGGRPATMVARGTGGALVPSGYSAPQGTARGAVRAGAKPKDLLMIPARVALALQADGWYLRSEIIWAKPNPMPESCRDRPTSAHEKVFLFSKNARYFYDADAVDEPAAPETAKRYAAGFKQWGKGQFLGSPIEKRGPKVVPADRLAQSGSTRNLRNVWSIASEPSPIAHFAMMPTALAEICIKAGCPPGGTVLDPFGGAGTTGIVADRLGRSAVLIELSPTHAATARTRVSHDAGMFAMVAAE
jgi:DNA modification methylase